MTLLSSTADLIYWNANKFAEKKSFCADYFPVKTIVNALSANATKWSNTLEQLIGNWRLLNLYEKLTEGKS